MTAAQQLDACIDKFSPEIAACVRAVFGRLRKSLRGALVLVYDNYNALAIGFGPTEQTSDAILSIAVYPRWVNLYFLQGAGLPDPDKRLKGQGRVGRYVRLADVSTLDEPAVQALIRAALQRARRPLDPEQRGRLIIKSISEKQRPRRVAGS